MPSVASVVSTMACQCLTQTETETELGEGTTTEPAVVNIHRNLHGFETGRLGKGRGRGSGERASSTPPASSSTTPNPKPNPAPKSRNRVVPPRTPNPEPDLVVEHPNLNAETIPTVYPIENSTSSQQMPAGTDKE